MEFKRYYPMVLIRRCSEIVLTIQLKKKILFFSLPVPFNEYFIVFEYLNSHT